MTNRRGKKTRKKRGKRLVWLVEYLLVVPLVLFVRLLPFGIAMRLGGWLAGLFYRLDRRHREVTLDNLAMCLKDKSPAERSEIARSAYTNVGLSVVEFIHSARYARRPLESHFRFVNYDAFDKAHEKGRGVLLLTAHCGSWEIMALAQSLLGHPFGVVVRPLDNPYLDKLVEGMRGRFGNIVINKKRGMRTMLRALSDNMAVGILLDQNVARSEGVFVDFFGVPACTNKGLALIASKSKAPVVPAFTRRTGPDTHEIVLGDEIPLIDTGDKDADILANTQMYTKAIEDFVSTYPDQWFWMHRRWKTRPKEITDA